MLILLVLVLSFALAAVSRRCGASRRWAVAVPTIPAALVFAYCAIRHDLDVDLGHVSIPAWIVAGIVLFIALVAGLAGAWAVKGKK